MGDCVGEWVDGLVGGWMGRGIWDGAWGWLNYAGLGWVGAGPGCVCGRVGWWI